MRQQVVERLDLALGRRRWMQLPRALEQVVECRRIARTAAVYAATPRSRTYRSGSSPSLERHDPDLEPLLGQQRNRLLRRVRARRVRVKVDDHPLGVPPQQPRCASVKAVRSSPAHSGSPPARRYVETKTIARGTPGFSGADLANLVNEAALMAARRNRRMVTMRDFEDAKDKVMMGAERKSMVMTEDEKKMTAYHEGGHALVALNVPATDPVHKATIIPRGRALGMVMQLPERDKLSMSYEQMTSRLAILFGGRVAEEIIFGKEKVTSGASSDITQATKLAKAMVTKWGFSDILGAVEYGENQEEVFLGHSVARNQSVSEETAKIIDQEVKRLVLGGQEEARRILSEKIEDLHTIAKAMLEFETLSGDEIINLLKGIQPTRVEIEDVRPAGPNVAVPLTHSKPEPKTDDFGGAAPVPA